MAVHMQFSGGMSLPLKALLAAVVVFGAVALVAALGVGGRGGGPAGPALARPARGEVVAAALPDGAPVFVVGHRDGDVSVLSAIDTHLQKLAVFCPDSRTFVEPGPVSRWDEYGRYLFGPAPGGLAPYAVSLDGGTVRVGRRLPPPPRTVDPVPIAEGGDCYEHEGIGGIRHGDQDLPPLVAPDRLPGDGSFVRVTALLHIPAEGLPRLCEAEPAATTCPPGAPAAVSSFFERSMIVGSVGHVRGTFLGRSTPTGLAELAGPLDEANLDRLHPRVPVPDLPAVQVGGRLDSVGDISRQGTAVVTFEDPVVTEDGRDERLHGTRPYSLSDRAQIVRFAGDAPHDFMTVQELAVLLAGDVRYDGEAHVDATGQIVYLWIVPRLPPQP